jgi:hypothetical protein
MVAVAGIGGQLAIRNCGLVMRLPRDCSPELKVAIRQHKAELLVLLTLDFLIVRSDALNATILWCPEGRTKEALIAAGADGGSIYTPDELGALVNRRITASELPMIHQAKSVFDGRIKPLTD